MPNLYHQVAELLPHLDDLTPGELKRQIQRAHQAVAENDGKDPFHMIDRMKTALAEARFFFPELSED